MPLPEGFTIDEPKKEEASAKGLPEGFTIDKPPTWGEQGEDIVRSGVAGIGRGVTSAVGLPGTVADLASRGLGWATGTDPESWRDKKENRLPTGEDVTKAAEKYAVSGKFYDPKTTAGKYAETVGEFLPYAATGPGGIARRVITQALVPGVASEATQEATKGTVAEIPATVAGAVLGTAGAQKAASRLAKMGAYKGAPIAAELEGSVPKRYGAARDLGVEFKPSAVAEGIADVKKSIEAHPDNAKGVFNVLNAAEREHAPTPAQTSSYWDPKTQSRKTVITAEATEKAPVPFDKLEAVRRELNPFTKSTDATERMAAKQAQLGIDDFFIRAGKNPSWVAKGDAAELAKVATTARQEAAANFRMRAVEAIREQAELAGEKGLNVERTYRNKLSAFITPNKKGISPAQKEGFTKQEIKEIRKLARIATFPNLLRSVGTLAGHHVGALISTGSVMGAYHTGDPRYLEGLAAVGVGAGAKAAGNAIMRARIAKAARMTASRSPLAREMGVKAPGPAPSTLPSILRSPLGTLPEIQGPSGFKRGGRVTRGFTYKTGGTVHLGVRGNLRRLFRRRADGGGITAAEWEAQTKDPINAYDPSGLSYSFPDGTVHTMSALPDPVSDYMQSHDKYVANWNAEQATSGGDPRPYQEPTGWDTRAGYFLNPYYPGGNAANPMRTTSNAAGYQGPMDIPQSDTAVSAADFRGEHPVGDFRAWFRTPLGGAAPGPGVQPPAASATAAGTPAAATLPSVAGQTDSMAAPQTTSDSATATEAANSPAALGPAYYSDWRRFFPTSSNAWIDLGRSS